MRKAPKILDIDSLRQFLWQRRCQPFLCKPDKHKKSWQKGYPLSFLTGSFTRKRLGAEQDIRISWVRG